MSVDTHSRSGSSAPLGSTITPLWSTDANVIWTAAKGADIASFLKKGVADLRADGRRMVVAATDTGPEGDTMIAEATWAGLPIRHLDRYEFGRLLEHIDRSAMCHDAGHGLHVHDRSNSTLQGIRPWQFAVAGGAVALLAAALCLDWRSALQALVAVMIVIMAVLVLFRGTCMLASLAWHARRTDAADTAALSDDELPTYSILVPMLREREATLRGLVTSLSRIDYPHEKLQVLFILEETDHGTRAIVDDIDLPPWFNVILIPDAPPHTKGKACNYAMNFATGDYFTIYDAEDHPDPLQLKKAIAAFRREGPDVVCVQSQLNFYNFRENWLTRMFTLDYSAWYFFMLPGMDALRLPICLGGTSNHFRARAVRDLCLWDAYNVTEDADLGLRIAKSGQRTILIDSITYEEATNRVPSWIRQRTRWMKGYMLTYLVHMRRPLALMREVGLWGFLGIQLFVAGNFVGNLIIPPLLAVAGARGLSQGFGWKIVDVFPDRFEWLAFATLMVGNFAAIGFAMAAGLRRGPRGLALYALTSPVYWALGVVATYRALWQVFFSPYRWEKTEHGVSKLDVSLALGAHGSTGQCCNRITRRRTTPRTSDP